MYKFYQNSAIYNLLKALISLRKCKMESSETSLNSILRGFAWSLFSRHHLNLSCSVTRALKKSTLCMTYKKRDFLLEWVIDEWTICSRDRTFSSDLWDVAIKGILSSRVCCRIATDANVARDPDENNLLSISDQIWVQFVNFCQKRVIRFHVMWSLKRWQRVRQNQQRFLI